MYASLDLYPTATPKYDDRHLSLEDQIKNKQKNLIFEKGI